MTKKEALGIVFSCAPLYKENLVDQSLLFVTTDKHKEVHCLEVTFDTSNFLHMTGFKLRKPGINARHFFNLCYDKRLTESDFDFASDGTTEMKMRVLPSLMKKNLSAKMLGDYNLYQPKLYTDKLAGSLSACMGFVRDGGNGRFVPNTVLEGDIRTKVKHADRIILTYRKKRSDAQYAEIVFQAKKVEWKRLYYLMSTATFLCRRLRLQIDTTTAPSTYGVLTAEGLAMPKRKPEHTATSCKLRSLVN